MKRRMLILAAAIMPFAATAEPDISRRFAQLEREIPSLYLLNGLYLSPEQNDELARILRTAGEERTRMLHRLQLLEDQVRGQLDQDRPRPGDGLRDAMRKGQELRGELAQRTAELEREVHGLLRPAQRAIVDQFTPCFVPPQDFRDPVRVGQASTHGHLDTRVFEALRRAPAAELDAARNRALNVLVPYVMKERHMKYSAAAEEETRRRLAKRLEDALPDIRGLSDAEYELEKDGLMDGVLQLETADEKKETVRYEEALGKIGGFVINPGCLDAVESRGKRGASREAGAFAGFEDLREMGTQVRTLRLLFRLGLAGSQVEQVLGVLREGCAARALVEGTAAALKASAVPHYERLRGELAAGEPKAETEQVCQRYHGQVKDVYERDLVEALRPYEQKLDLLLTADQVAALADEDLAERGAVPRAVTHPALMQREAAALLDRARGMNAGEFDRRKSELASSFAVAAVARSGDPELGARSETARAIGILETARRLPRAEYARQREALAVELCPKRASPRPVEYGTRYDRGEPLPVLSRGTYLLFTDYAVDLLERMKRRVAGTAAPRAMRGS